MRPIDISGNQTPVDIQSQAFDKSKENNNSNNETVKQDGQPSADRFLKSDILEAIGRLATSPTLEDSPEHLQKIATIKEQIQNGTYPVISDDQALRDNATRRLADKLVANGILSNGDE